MRLPGLLIPRSREGRRALGGAIALGAFSALAVVAQAWLLALVLARLLDDGAEARGWTAPAWLVAVAIARALSAWGSEVLAARAAGGVRRRLREALVGRLLALGPAFTAGERSGAIVHTLTDGVEVTDTYVRHYVVHAVLAAVVPVVVAALVTWLDPLSGLVLVLTGPLIPLFMILIGSAARGRSARQWRVLSHASARFLDAVQGLPTLHAFGAVGRELEAIRQTSERYRSASMGVLRLAFLSALALEGLATLSTAVVAVEVGLRVLYGWMPFREAMFVLLLAPEFYRPLRTLGASFHASTTGLEAATRIEAVLGDHRERGDPPADVPPPIVVRSVHQPGPQRVVFDDVWFRYGEDRPWALRGLSFVLEPRATLAIVGPSGAGKSTVLQLLLRFVVATRGSILVGRTSLAGMDAEAWRHRVAWVPQQPHLFDATIRENVLLGRPWATRAELDRALALSQADEVVGALAEGLDTRIGERGARLSGGQAQRLAIARAVLAGADLLLLDEPTSQLDAVRERRVIEGLAGLRGTTTIVVVTHRLAIAAAADQVLVLGDGERLQIGAPGDLGRAPGPFQAALAAFAGRA
jgi:ATP-binding cassette subfamily C protein CydD